MIAIGMTAIVMLVMIAPVIIAGLSLRGKSGELKKRGDCDGKGFGVQRVLRSLMLHVW